MKYPLDSATSETMFGHLLANERAQRHMVMALTLLLEEAIHAYGSTDLPENDANQEWYEESKKLLDLQKKINTESVGISDPQVNAKLNEVETSFGEEMSEEDVARMFKEKVDKKKESADFTKMSLEEIKEWEEKQDNSNDIYKVKARVANLARGTGASLTPQGEMLANTFVHVLKSLYDFAETIENKETRIALIKKIRSHEGMPANLIAAAGVGVKK